MKFKEIPREGVERINSTVQGTPVFVYRWLSFFPMGSEAIFSNSLLSSKVVATGLWASGALMVPYAYEVVRHDGECLDVDRHILTASGAIILRKREIDKNFSEHHSSSLPVYYN